MTAALWLRSRAKLNLCLGVTGRRPDGYHLLDTVYHELALHDDVAVRLTEGGVTVGVTADQEGLLVPADERNLAAQALQSVLDHLGLSCGFHVQIHKRIPSGGGLGGGSSNAAASLRIANALLGDVLSDEAVATLAIGLGADVPFFLAGGSQRGQGVGEELTAVDVAGQHFVLILPPYGCATAEVYKNYARMLAVDGAADTVLRNTAFQGDGGVMAGDLYNDLEQAAEQLRPQLGRLRRAVGAAGYEHVRMTGSGSTLFVICRDPADALDCRRALERSLAGTEHQGVGLLETQSAVRGGSLRPSPELPQTVLRAPPA